MDSVLTDMADDLESLDLGLMDESEDESLGLDVSF